MSRIDSRPRSRAIYAGLVLLTIAAGLASRQFPDLEPAWVADYAGDTLWASMIFFLLALVATRARTLLLGAEALAVSWAVEVSQLIHRPWLDALRATRGGALVLGQGFLWSDMLCYVVGVAIAAAVDLTCRAR